MLPLKDIKDSVLHLVFPQVCAGCGSDLVNDTNRLCIYCHEALPETSFHLHGNNPIEKLFWGRLPIANATAQYYFSKQSLIQNQSLFANRRFNTPTPVSIKRKKKRL
jgi:hypothetical protein